MEAAAEEDSLADHARMDSPHAEKEEDSVAEMRLEIQNSAKELLEDLVALVEEDLEETADPAKETFPHAEEKAHAAVHSAHAPRAIPMISRITPSARNSGTKKCDWRASANRLIIFYSFF